MPAPITCSACSSTVVPVRKVKLWVLGLWLLFFWPGAIAYYVTRNPTSCPSCGERAYEIRPPAARPNVKQPTPMSPIEQNAREQVAERKAGRSAAKWVTIIAVVGMGLIGACVIAVVAVAVSSDSEDTSTAAGEDSDEKRKGFHCLSTWDGNHDGFEALVRERLNDPGSMETYETRIGPVNREGRHKIVMDFGAKNAFGGMIRSQATGWVGNQSCKATVVSIE